MTTSSARGLHWWRSGRRLSEVESALREFGHTLERTLEKLPGAARPRPDERSDGQGHQMPVFEHS